ncbi:hypothetical protein GGX14DRAFT_389119 [Mycena pura]|uniref:Uncharacterized protein n=1 Tax=Mycena pura TaxID=153505 RepID=A0AAD6VRS6_9AGAR|nr:hypothetical protein GGX14DRAFT_389119 [Mycena pura]
MPPVPSASELMVTVATMATMAVALSTFYNFLASGIVISASESGVAAGVVWDFLGRVLSFQYFFEDMEGNWIVSESSIEENIEKVILGMYMHNTGGISLDEIVNKDGSISCRNAFKRNRIQGATAIVAIVATVTINSDAGGAEGTGGIDAAGTEGTGGCINYDSGCNQYVWSGLMSQKLLRAWAIGAIVAIVAIVTIDVDAGGAEGTRGIDAAGTEGIGTDITQATAIVAIVTTVTINSDAGGAEGTRGIATGTEGTGTDITNM